MNYLYALVLASLVNSSSSDCFGRQERDFCGHCPRLEHECCGSTGNNPSDLTCPPSAPYIEAILFKKCDEVIIPIGLDCRPLKEKLGNPCQRPGNCGNANLLIN